jgi:hypothetical protein
LECCIESASARNRPQSFNNTYFRSGIIRRDSGKELVNCLETKDAEVKTSPPSMLTLDSDVLDRNLMAHGKASLISIVLKIREHFKCSIFVNFPQITVHSILFHNSVAKILEYQILLLLG